MPSATQSDIAKFLGVSQNTVSLALRGSERISESVRKKVAEAASRLGYSPNFAGLAMVTGRLNSLALVIGTDADRSSMTMDLMHGVLDGAATHDRHVQLAKLSDASYVEGQPQPRFLRELAVDGILVNYGWGHPPELDHFIQRHHVPAVWLNTLRETHCVRPDDWGAGGRALKELVAVGCRNTAWVDFSMSDARLASGQHYSLSARAEGFRAAAEAAGVSARIIRPPNDPGYQDYQRLADAFFAEHVEFDGLAINGRETAQALVIAMQAIGRMPVRDLPMIAVSDRPLWSICGGLPTLVIPHHAVGKRSVDMLLQLIQDPKPRAAEVVGFGFYAGGYAEPTGTDVSGARSS